MQNSSNRKWRLNHLAVLGYLIMAAGANTLIHNACASADTTAELAKMFEQDQAEREDAGKNPRPGQWKAISCHDREHRARVLELMKENRLKSADDFYHAAMIMQHGDTPADFTLAHVFAMAAAQKGNKEAVWLSAASFDRLMQSAGQPQVFATQYYKNANDPYVLKQPMEADLITDSIRQVFNVPTFEESRKRLLKLNN
ncbi:MAG: hypothetical protein AB7W16_08935 [Candidatus Obscuribacterales bacterium]